MNAVGSNLCLRALRIQLLSGTAGLRTIVPIPVMTLCELVVTSKWMLIHLMFMGIPKKEVGGKRMGVASVIGSFRESLC